MKIKQRLIVTLLMTMFMGMQVMAQNKAYAEYNANTLTLTFHYDANMSSYGNNAYELRRYTGNEYESFDFPEWMYGDDDLPFKIHKVVFLDSFKNARPICTCYWFDELDLVTIEGIDNLNTSKVKCMEYMFCACDGLTSIDLSGFDTSNVTKMNCMFWGCEGLTSLDLSSFDTSNVTRMYDMFAGCSNLTSLDLSSFDTRNATKMSDMFSNCKNLKTIYVGDYWSTDLVHSSESLFDNCYSLVGEEGTEYDPNHLGKEYAHIDGGTSNPGYFSFITSDLKIAGTPVSGTNKRDILGNGVFSYSPSSKTLTVKGNYTNNNDNDIIRSKIDGLIIDVSRDAVLAEPYNYSAGCPIWLDASATIKGSGKLTLKGPRSNAGLYLYNGASVTIDHMDLDIESKWGISGPWEQHYNNEKLIVKSSNINITTPEDDNSSAAICDLSGGIELYGCSITAPPGAYINRYGVRYMGELVKSATITADEGVSTGIDNGQIDSVKGQRESWYTIDGQKLNGKPTKKGVYIRNGKAVVN